MQSQKPGQLLERLSACPSAPSPQRVSAHALSQVSASFPQLCCSCRCPPTSHAGSFSLRQAPWLGTSYVAQPVHRREQICALNTFASSKTPPKGTDPYMISSFRFSPSPLGSFSLPRLCRGLSASLQLVFSENVGHVDVFLRYSWVEVSSRSSCSTI